MAKTNRCADKAYNRAYLPRRPNCHVVKAHIRPCLSSTYLAFTYLASIYLASAYNNIIIKLVLCTFCFALHLCDAYFTANYFNTLLSNVCMFCEIYVLCDYYAICYYQ